jgi:hypothetical protein
MVCDNFWIGGRETFIADVVYMMRKIGVESISLISGQIGNPSVETIFDQAVNVGDAKSIDRWLELGDALIEQISPQLIWAHHYSLVPSLLLAERHKLPLHITIHGPLMSTGRYNFSNALGFSMAAYTGATVSGVSEEIKGQLTSFSDDIDCWGVFPNKVRVSGKNNKQTPVSETLEQNSLEDKSHVIRFAVFSRQNKLGHLRQAVLLAHQFKLKGHLVRLDIYTGINKHVGIANTRLSPLQQKLSLFGRKWFIRNARLIPFTKHIHVHPLTHDVGGAMQKSDVILGMGRVTLEAIANLKTSVLIGYDDAIGVVNSDSFKLYQSTNFSGREQRRDSYEKIVNDTLEALSISQQELSELATLVDIEATESSLAKLLSYASNANPITIKTEKMKQLLGDNAEVLDQNQRFIPIPALEPYENKLLKALVGVEYQAK